MRSRGLAVELGYPVDTGRLYLCPTCILDTYPAGVYIPQTLSRSRTASAEEDVCTDRMRQDSSSRIIAVREVRQGSCMVNILHVTLK